MAQRQPQYTGPYTLEILVLLLVIGGAVVGGLYGFGILPPGSDSGGPVTRRTAQATNPQNPTTALAPTPEPSPSLNQSGAQNGAQNGDQNGVETGEQPAQAASSPAATLPSAQAQSPEATPAPETTLSPPATSAPGDAPTPTAIPAPTPTAELPPAAAAPFDGIYTLTVSQPLEVPFAGKAISFRIGDLPANETSIWQQGQTHELDLTASSSAAVPGPSDRELARGNRQSLAGTLLAGPLRQPAPPSVFQGTA